MVYDDEKVIRSFLFLVRAMYDRQAGRTWFKDCKASGFSLNEKGVSVPDFRILQTASWQFRKVSARPLDLNFSQLTRIELSEILLRKNREKTRFSHGKSSITGKLDSAHNGSRKRDRTQGECPKLVTAGHPKFQIPSRLP